MSFSRIDSNQQCSICFEPFTGISPAIAHEDGGETHPIGERCLRTWIAICREQYHPATCPICRHVITHIHGISITENPADVRAASRVFHFRVPLYEHIPFHLEPAAVETPSMNISLSI